MSNTDKYCKLILDAQNYFECFGIPCTPIEPGKIRTLYLQKAIKVHPDKNSSSYATAAFQKLTEAFDTLHDEEKQHSYLISCKPECRFKRKKRKKSEDIADKVVPVHNWYKMDWESVENEIQRMTNEFKGHLAKAKEKKERAKEKKMERRQRHEKRVKQNLNYLYEKYGIDPESDSESERGHTSVATTNNSIDSSADLSPIQKAPQSFVCMLCRRQFLTDSHLQNHFAKSELHKQNLEHAEQERSRMAEDDSWKPFKCGKCNRRFLYAMNLKSHEKRHAQQDCKECKLLPSKPRRCPHVEHYCVYCNRVFADYDEFKEDRTQHRLKPECRYCKKVFRQLYTLKTHMNIHTGLRPYVCDVCGYSCHSPQVLRHHELFNHVSIESRSPT